MGDEEQIQSLLCGKHCSTIAAAQTEADLLKAIPPAVCRALDELRLLYEVARILQENTNLRRLFPAVLSAICSQPEFLCSSLQIKNRATDKLELAAATPFPDKQLHKEFDGCNAYLSQRVFETGLPWLFPIALTQSAASPTSGITNLPDEFFSQPPGTLLCIPISLETQILGLLSVVLRPTSKQIVFAHLRLLRTLAQLIARAVHLRQQSAERIEYLRKENERLQKQMQCQFRPENMIGNSRAMQTVYLSIEQVASSQTTVLIRGESGTGKELVAQAIHAASSRKDKPFVKLNCAALPESIVESELFGHERGAFTGAIAMRKGRFELAHRGTIFLDEIGELPITTQVKLLRVLQEREFERVGGTETLRCDVLVIAATNRDLEKLVAEGKFREDLYYRLNVFPIYLPPLRERKSDILLLADYFIEKYNRLNGKQVRRISTPAIEMLMSYSWPGNVRELENVIERATILASEGVIHGHHLPPTLQMPIAPTADEKRPTLKAALDAFEREMIYDALKANRGNMAAAARQLGISERIMALRVKKYSLDPASFRF
ncbi:MAG: sigma 54-interacting transcriptional regulator [Chthoniobacterales bacterium]|nr:sigma 54-interacting transcriptional regulator [Chthoniobacterales bacterium]